MSEEKKEIKIKTTHKEIYVIGLPEMGGSWLSSAKYYSDYNLAKRLVDESRARGVKVQLFTLFEYVEDRPEPTRQELVDRMNSTAPDAIRRMKENAGSNPKMDPALAAAIKKLK